MFYPVVIHQEGDSAFGVIVPDLPGCFSAGDTFGEAVENAGVAIDLHLEGMADDGEELPVPSDVSALKDNPDFSGGVWAMIPVDLTRYLGTAQRFNVSMPARLLTKIDRFVDEHKEYKDRSKFLADAAMKVLHHT